MTEEQPYSGGTILVGTEELNPRLNEITLTTPENVKYSVFSDGTVYGDVIVDTTIALPTTLFVIGTNDGDENLDFHVLVTIDGNVIIDQTKTNIVPINEYAMAALGSVGANQVSAGMHSIAWEISVRRSGTDEAFQTFEENSTTYSVGTPELNLDLMSVGMLVQAGVGSYPFYIGEGYSLNIPPDNIEMAEPGYYDGQLIDLSMQLPYYLITSVRNIGDESLDVNVEVSVDNVARISDTKVFAPGVMVPVYAAAVTSDMLTVGAHTCSWTVRARRSGSGDAFSQFYVGSVTYYCYTESLDAYAFKVTVIQDGQPEADWLLGDKAGFEELPLRLIPGLVTAFKFYLTNTGDEQTKIKIGHPSGDQYVTGIVVDGSLIATSDDPIYIDPGATAELMTGSFIPNPPSVSIGAFSVMRARVYGEAPSGETSFNINLQPCTGDNYNMISVPVSDSRNIIDILSPAKYNVLAIYTYNGTSWVPHIFEEPFVSGTGYAIQTSSIISETVTGVPLHKTASYLISELTTGWNLVGVGIDVIDLTGTGYTAKQNKPDGTVVDGITLLQPGQSYWIEVASAEPVCANGTHEVINYCPDGITEKQWRDCVNGDWVYDQIITCPSIPEESQIITLKSGHTYDIEILVDDPRTISEVCVDSGTLASYFYFYDQLNGTSVAISDKFIKGNIYHIYNAMSSTMTLTLHT